MKSLFREFFQANVRASHWIDQRVPARLRVDGNQDYGSDFAWRYLRSRQTLYDIGGGKQPFLTPAEKRKLRCRVIGLDISAEELSRAPVGAYDEIIVGDIASFEGRADADVVLCRAVLEHVADVPAAIASVASILKPGGVSVLFIPCRNAAFARLNLLLPESIKRRLLFSAFPTAKLTQGFPSYYDRCTPAAISKLATLAGMKVIETRRYYMNSYFSVLLPLYVVWRAWTLIASAIGDDNLCETFSIALEKPLDNAAVEGQGDTP